MSVQSDRKANVTRSLATLLTFVFLVWAAGAHAFPVYGDHSASSLVVDAHGYTDSSTDGTSPTDDGPLRRVVGEISPFNLSSSALVHLAFDGPGIRLLSYPGLPQGPPSEL